MAFTWAPKPPPNLWHIYLGEKTPAERHIHATLFNLLQGDAWLMINRHGTWSALPDRKGEFEIGGSLGIDLEFDFTIAKAWLNASIAGEVRNQPRPTTVHRLAYAQRLGRCIGLRPLLRRRSPCGGSG